VRLANTPSAETWEKRSVTTRSRSGSSMGWLFIPNGCRSLSPAAEVTLSTVCTNPC